jgi:hypothetical protein
MNPASMPTLQIRDRHGDRLKLHRSPPSGEVSKARRQPHSAADPLISGNGTALALSYSTLGVAALSAGGTGRGGARNRAARVSHALTAAHVANLTAAEAHARTIGMPFTRMLTIHWEAAGVPLAGMAKATGRFTDLLARALPLARPRAG